MSHRKKRRKASGKAIPTPPRKPGWSRARWLALFIGFVALAVSVWAFKRTKPLSPPSGGSPKSGMPSLADFLAMTPADLAHADIGLMNLRCAEGLRGSEGLDVAASLKVLDQMARYVKRETEQNFHLYDEAPGDFENSEPYFRLMMMATVLQEDGKVHYNPARISTPDGRETNAKFFADAKDVFIHGSTGPPMAGTCSSLPVLYVAVGRRLNYPLRLVATKGHLFVRWEDEKVRLNMEATSLGFKSDSDDFYKTWPYRITDDEVAANGYLKSMTPSEELACFMSLRGHCFYDGMGHYKQGIEAYRSAFQLAPHTPAYRTVLDISIKMLQARRADQMMWLLDNAENRDALPPPPGLFPNQPTR